MITNLILKILFVPLLLVLVGVLVLYYFQIDNPNKIRQSHWVHDGEAIRLGGLVIYPAIFISISFSNPLSTSLLLPLMLASLPLYINGIFEDLHFQTRPILRLLVSNTSAALAVAISQIWITEVGIPFIDYAFEWPVFAIIFTILLTGALPHGFNLIDGLHGLSAGTALIASAGMAVLLFESGDNVIALEVTIFCSVLFAFFVINVTTGRLFLGDSGAYLVGFLVAWLSVVILHLDTEISPWCFVLLSVYPISDLISTCVRRFVNKKPLLAPDQLHIHSLLRLLLLNVFRLTSYKANVYSSFMLLSIAIFAALVAVNNKTSGFICGSSFVILLALHILIQKICEFHVQNKF